MADYEWYTNQLLIVAGSPKIVRKTVTFTGAAGLGAAGAVSLFTITGRVLVERIVPYCSTLLTETGGTATLALGVTGSTALFIAATGATAIDAGEFWVDTTPDPAGIALPAALKGVPIAADIIATVADATINAGVIAFDVYWRPLSDAATLVAA